MKRTIHYGGMLLLAGLLVFILASCSAPHDLPSEKAQQATSWISQLYSQGVIDSSTLAKAQQHISSYDSRSFIGKYWMMLLYIPYALLGMVCSLTQSSDLDADSKVKVSTVYGIWAYAGIWGGHKMRLSPYGGAGAYYSVMAVLGFFVLPAAFLFNWTAINYYWATPELFLHYAPTWAWSQPSSYYLLAGEVLIAVTLLVNIVIPALLIPYWVYQYNNETYRHHFENDLILRNQKTQVDYQIGNIKKLNNELAESLPEINSYVAQGVDYDRDLGGDFGDRLGRFTKNIFTLGSYSSMLREKEHLKDLQQLCQYLYDKVEDAQSKESIMEEELERMRKAAYRNLYLAKELVSAVKDKVSSKGHYLVKDELPEMIQQALPSIARGGQVSTFQVEAAIDTHLTNIGNKVGNMLDYALSHDLKNSDEQGELIIQALGVALESILAIFTLNSEVNRVRIQLEEHRGRILDAIDSAQHNIQAYQATLARFVELVSALDQCNKAFVKLYEPLSRQVFAETSLKNFLFGIRIKKGFDNSPEFQSQLAALLEACRLYNQINISAKL